MAGVRGFYRTTCEDHITPALFHNWALFPDASWVAALINGARGAADSVTKVRWAYECNERLDSRLQPFHKRNFIIPDIMLHYEDKHGLGLVAFEAKKPGKAIEAADVRKLASYIDLPSTRGISRRYGCMLVSDQVADQSRQTCNGKFPVLTWEGLAQLQLGSARDLKVPAAIIEQVTGWIRRAFANYGVQTEPATAPVPAGLTYGSDDSYRRIDGLFVPDSVRRFLKGSECVEAVRSGLVPDPALPWLADEPTADAIRLRSNQKRGWQTSDDRYLRRWSFDWDFSQESIWR